MAEALGWGATDRPVPTLCADGGPGGGPESFPSGSRQTLANARERDLWRPQRPAAPARVPQSAELTSGGTDPLGLSLRACRHRRL
ncbi:hypothetical protein GCM10010256_80280 [Streptomyces coeruleorubidus]|nr:hypothetical protein GCM10010256_80280 [Streptomyces coeruleorubidus]